MKYLSTYKHLGPRPILKAMDEFRRSEDILNNDLPTPSPKSMEMVKQSSTKKIGPVVHRCYKCSYTASNRSRIYSHYACKHFKKEILKIYPEKDICPICSTFGVHAQCNRPFFETGIYNSQKHSI